MANPRLAKALEVLRETAADGRKILQSDELGRLDRQRLLAAGFLQEVVRGWLIVTRPEQAPGETTSWYASYWDFCAEYLTHRFKDDWVISPEASLSIHAGDRAVPQQLIAHTPHGSNHKIDLPHGSSIYDLKKAIDRKSITRVGNLIVYRLPIALCLVGPAFFQKSPGDAVAALGSIRNIGDILAPLLEGGHASAAGRLAGAFRTLEKPAFADQIVGAMKSMHHDVREENPFEVPIPFSLGKRATPPIVSRIKMMWAEMRGAVLEEFEVEATSSVDAKSYLAELDERYVDDAYNSLSIEGYEVTPELIEQVRSGKWNPEKSEADKAQTAALAARGYYDAFQSVKASIRKILAGQTGVIESDLQRWFFQLFQPSVQAGILGAERLAGYRSHPVYIRNSMHVPVNPDMVTDAMEAFFECLADEDDARVRAVLGHFVFTFIHPYMDVNGRIGRFIMNAGMASGHYPWTIVPVSRRADYMRALEDASGRRNIRPFTRFVVECLRAPPKPSTQKHVESTDEDTALAFRR